MNLNTYDLPKHWAPAFLAFLAALLIEDGDVNDMLAADQRITGAGITEESEQQFREVLNKIFPDIVNDIPEELYVIPEPTTEEVVNPVHDFAPPGLPDYWTPAFCDFLNSIPRPSDEQFAELARKSEEIDQAQGLFFKNDYQFNKKFRPFVAQMFADQAGLLPENLVDRPDSTEKQAAAKTGSTPSIFNPTEAEKDAGDVHAQLGAELYREDEQRILENLPIEVPESFSREFILSVLGSYRYAGLSRAVVLNERLREDRVFCTATQGDLDRAVEFRILTLLSAEAHRETIEGSKQSVGNELEVGTMDELSNASVAADGVVVDLSPRTLADLERVVEQSGAPRSRMPFEPSRSGHRQAIHSPADMVGDAAAANAQFSHRQFDPSAAGHSREDFGRRPHVPMPQRAPDPTAYSRGNKPASLKDRMSALEERVEFLLKAQATQGVSIDDDEQLLHDMIKLLNEATLVVTGRVAISQSLRDYGEWLFDQTHTLVVNMLDIDIDTDHSLFPAMMKNVAQLHNVAFSAMFNPEE